MHNAPAPSADPSAWPAFPFGTHSGLSARCWTWVVFTSATQSCHGCSRVAGGWLEGRRDGASGGATLAAAAQRHFSCPAHRLPAVHWTSIIDWVVPGITDKRAGESGASQCRAAAGFRCDRLLPRCTCIFRLF